jgi:hypothetical protein
MKTVFVLEFFCLSLALTAILGLGAQSAIAAQPVYAVREYADVVIDSIYAKQMRITIRIAQSGTQTLSLGPKTWIIKDNNEGKFENLEVGQHLHVWQISRGGQAIAVEILPSRNRAN